MSLSIQDEYTRVPKTAAITLTCDVTGLPVQVKAGNIKEFGDFGGNSPFTHVIKHSGEVLHVQEKPTHIMQKLKDAAEAKSLESTPHDELGPYHRWWKALSRFFVVAAPLLLLLVGCSALREEQLTRAVTEKVERLRSESTGGHVIIVVPDLIKIWPFCDVSLFKYTSITVTVPPTKVETDGRKQGEQRDPQAPRDSAGAEGAGRGQRLHEGEDEGGRVLRSHDGDDAIQALASRPR